MSTTKTPPQETSDTNEGEGSRTAARNYNRATEAYVKSGKSEQAAQAAKAAVDGPEGEELRRAEEVGKKAAKVPAKKS